MNTKVLLKSGPGRSPKICRTRPAEIHQREVSTFSTGNIRDFALQKQASRESPAANLAWHIRVAELEAALAERTAQVEETIAELERFSHSISHDMRTPLRTIRGFAELLLDQHASQLDAEGSAYLNKINAASARMDQLIQAVCTYTRTLRGETKAASNKQVTVGRVLISFQQKNVAATVLVELQ